MSNDTALTLELNALTQPLYYRLGSLVRQADAHPDTLVTLIIGTGRVFSAGADLQARPATAASSTEDEPRKAWLSALVNNTIDVPSAFFTHSKILICALNGPVLGLSAALVSHSDFIYAAPGAYLLTPFGSLGLASEGGASAAFIRRLGFGLANEALLKGRKIRLDELKAAGFVNTVVEGKDDSDFRALVLEDIRNSFGAHLVPSSVIEIKRIMRRSLIREQESLALDELFTGVNRFAEGIPQAEMKKIVTGEKKHKL
ncbi:peroxisomal d3,d2-enoyl-CoA isomerase [Aaosphaeria arxii CBS 175.79]|uniref:Peroxisomal d3,d2-enoyl-CoA isomerase n=1 Tax=Aaosphaeria arxii CBS 175.79 TaxID=1450172 RepID=A0A6A5Y3D2_9PLEO|nr:peroxisomal d3,d2-enoyl-CoA isomerase [Aaosphaeria arxii CBS 175.79]KAF2019968.1 peroxisomal d3,d2-enoyl-CoA isomerase [Aaosphaeria arxii CBS 175.79]